MLRASNKTADSVGNSWQDDIMSGPATCLFQNLNVACAGVSSEHVIPRCIGGTRESTEVLCDTCNHYFGDEIDPELCEHFEPIVTQLALVMGRRYQGRRQKTTSIDGSVRLTQRAGGVTGLAGIQRLVDADGKFTIAAPPNQAHLLPEIAAREAPGRAFIFRDALVTDLVPDNLALSRMGFPDELMRAVAKTQLEVVDEWSRSDGGRHFWRAPSLEPILRFIRLGGRAPSAEPSSPMADIGTEMLDAFARHMPGADLRRVALCTCVAVIYDAGAQRLFGLLSVAGTMPLIMSLAESGEWGAHSWSLLVRRSLLPGIPGEHVWIDEPAVSWRMAEWRTFLRRTQGAIDFGRCKYTESFADALGRAVVYVDETNDDAILDTLRLLRNKHGSCGPAVVDALKVRFMRNTISGAQWQAIQTRVDGQNLDVDDAQLLATFRRELADLVTQVGLPRAIVQLGVRAEAADS
jgi:hypothetical protein